MVKRPEKPPAPLKRQELNKARPSGAAGPSSYRPGFDPDDLRTSRYGIRLHPDLRTEIERLAREDGLRLSTWLEKVLIREVNERAGSAIVDNIGRYKQQR